MNQDTLKSYLYLSKYIIYLTGPPNWIKIGFQLGFGLVLHKGSNKQKLVCKYLIVCVPECKGTLMEFRFEITVTWCDILSYNFSEDS